ncbi:type I 3-dehydroquinate dehydratase [Paenibacillus sp. IB182496]|uniref:3-dehydroquinate dehydratase n=1 Tax=Paenibacillus sabuli TaxID=2772509 RepID=A0A927GTC8_9BACL|nr:type I 3-dehydroquinate dehydratase [Paenibacillus sabuli]MBD2846587.1 type I 3-dehydroquinate dehydratase [Paenibacillus sabuli]
MKNTYKPQLQVRSAQLGGGAYLLCVPLVSATREQLIADARAALAYRPDLLEWRADYQTCYPQPAPIAETLATLRQIAGDTPILFTSRHAAEDGAQAISEEEKFRLLDEVSRTGMADLVDIELRYGDARITQWKERWSGTGLRLIVSAHNFKRGWRPERIQDILRKEQQAGADIVKLVTRVKHVRELAELAEAIQEARETFLRVPVIAGVVGSLSPMMRMMGDRLGSDLTFVSAGAGKSHASQLHIDDLRRLRGHLEAPSSAPR